MDTVDLDQSVKDDPIKDPETFLEPAGPIGTSREVFPTITATPPGSSWDWQIEHSICVGMSAEQVSIYAQSEGGTQ